MARKGTREDLIDLIIETITYNELLQEEFDRGFEKDAILGAIDTLFSDGKSRILDRWINPVSLADIELTVADVREIKKEVRH